MTGRLKSSDLVKTETALMTRLSVETSLLGGVVMLKKTPKAWFKLTKSFDREDEN